MTREPRAVVLKGVRKRFGDVTAVADVDLEIRPGELMVLVGPSGCGKSTLLRLIAGLEEHDAGEVWIGDRCVGRGRAGQPRRGDGVSELCPLPAHDRRREPGLRPSGYAARVRPRSGVA